ncbi:MAG TPA: hypothetical protein VJ696_00505 [Rhodanobacteraceae bacterium]|nr:hypothetical protein [Rhodanobacteraceae bacterium]
MKRAQSSLSLIALGIAGALVITACGKKEENTPPPPAATTTPATPPPTATTTPPPAAAEAVSVTSVDLGTAVGPDQKVTSPTTTFGPKDTIYASVATTGTATNATLGAKWTFQDGQTVNDSSQTIAPTGPAVTTFHISKPDGWPAGNYKVEISLNGSPVSSKDFTVQ